MKHRLILGLLTVTALGALVGTLRTNNVLLGVLCLMAFLLWSVEMRRPKP
jgi:hypothetical protein